MFIWKWKKFVCFDNCFMAKLMATVNLHEKVLISGLGSGHPEIIRDKFICNARLKSFQQRGFETNFIYWLVLFRN